MNGKGLAAAVLGFLVVLVALVACVLSGDDDPSGRTLFLVIAIVVAVPSTLAAVGSLVEAGRRATLLLRVASALFAVVGVLLLPLLVPAVLCFSATWPGVSWGVLLLTLAGTVFLVGSVLTASLFVAPNAGDICLTRDRAREATSIDAGWGWWPPGLRCTYTDDRTGERTEEAPSDYWPVALGLLSVGCFAGSAAVIVRRRQRRRAVGPF